MRLLLDTNALLWWLSDSEVLSSEAKRVVGDDRNEVFVSAVSAVEISVKSSLGKLRAPDDLERQLEENDFTPLPLTVRHGLQLGQLPLHHRDPFDRMIIAQAQVETLAIVTSDHAFANYGITTIEARV